MKSYKEYYKIAESEIEFYNWGKNHTLNEYITNNEYTTLGDYIETVSFISLREKCDCRFFKNHTNVKNSEWAILTKMIGNAIVDWFGENFDYSKIDNYSIEINKEFEHPNILNYCHDIISFSSPITTEESKKIEECDVFICDMIERFLSEHGKNIPMNWNKICFGLDNLIYSCKYGKWHPASDGCFAVMNGNETLLLSL